jgi:hypothetical protein
MRRNGTIHVGDIEESLPPRPLADDFDALLDSVLMGDGYRLCMRDDDDDWHRFLVDQGWASS